MELQGTVKKVFDTQTFGSGFQKRELVILTQESYPQPINIEFLSDKIDLWDNVSEGEFVKVGINIRGRSWSSPQGEEKYFNSIVGWRIEKSDGQQPITPSNNVPHGNPQEVFDNSNPLSDEDDDSTLPF